MKIDLLPDNFIKKFGISFPKFFPIQGNGATSVGYILKTNNSTRFFIKKYCIDEQHFVYNEFESLKSNYERLKNETIVNIPKPFGLLKDNSGIIMEYIEGSTLDVLLKIYRKNNFEYLKTIFFTLGTALYIFNDPNIITKKNKDINFDEYKENLWETFEEPLQNITDTFKIDATLTREFKIHMSDLLSNIFKDDVIISTVHRDFRPRNIFLVKGKFIFFDLMKSAPGSIYFDLASLLFYLESLSIFKPIFQSDYQLLKSDFLDGFKFNFEKNFIFNQPALSFFYARAAIWQLRSYIHYLQNRRNKLLNSFHFFILQKKLNTILIDI
jgi:serine/threonine protein kinase